MDGDKILIVEDNAMNMELASDLLQAAGYRVLQAENAEAALQIARRERPALILMDIALPAMDGLAAAMKLKADKTTKHIPIVALTAHAMPGDEQKALAAGYVGYITKPVDTRTFVQTVASYIRPR